MENKTEKIAKPFLKWAGGKTQLITEIERSLPYEIKNKTFTYIEQFVGSGAVLFWMLNNSNVKSIDTNDNFFDEIYSEFLFSKVKARRSINAKTEKYYLGVPFGRAFRFNLLFLPHKWISTAIPKPKEAL
jgi:site-specific DNA-adenine methylase